MKHYIVYGIKKSCRLENQRELDTLCCVHTFCMHPYTLLENNKNFLQKQLRCRDGITSTERSCHTVTQYLAMGHACKGVAPYPRIWLVAEEVQSHYIKRNNIVSLASALYKAQNILQLLQFAQFHTASTCNARPWCMWCQCAFHNHALTVLQSKSQ